MPHYVIERVGEALNTKKKCINGSKILVLGMAYKKNVDHMLAFFGASLPEGR